MNEQQIYDQLLGIQNTIGGLDAKVDAIQEEVKLIHRYERRLGRVESDVKSIRRIFGGLWLLVVAGIGAVATWLRG